MWWLLLQLALVWIPRPGHLGSLGWWWLCILYYNKNKFITIADNKQQVWQEYNSLELLQVTYEKSDATQRSWWSFSILAPDRYCGLLPHRSWGQRQVLVAALPRCLSSQKTESRWPSQLGLKFCQSGCAARKLPTGARCARSRGARIEKSKFSFLGPQLYPDFRFESNWVRFQIWSHVNYSNRKRFWETTAECWLNDSLKRMPFSCLAGTMSGKHKSFYLICAASSLIALLDAKGWSGCKYLQLILFHPFSSVWQQKK